VQSDEADNVKTSDGDDASPSPRFAERATSLRDRQILDALLQGFSIQGCFQTNVDRVATEVGIGKGTLYRHYPSREDLFNSALKAGIAALGARCLDVLAPHEHDPSAGFHAVVTELVSLNRRRAAVSLDTLSRLGCGCHWMSKSKANDGILEAAIVPLVRRWQAARLFDESADPSWIAAVIVALVNSPAVINGTGTESDAADRLVDLFRRAFRAARRLGAVGQAL
jgi:AcrR family transcriptional regulator